MKALTGSALHIIGLSCSFTTLSMDRSPNTFRHNAHDYYYSSKVTDVVQNEIENNKAQITQFLSELSTHDDLYCPLPIQSRQAAVLQVPAIFDISRKKRNAHLIEIVIARRIPLIVQAENSSCIFHELARIGKSKVMKLFLDLYKKYKRNPSELIEAQTKNLWTPLMVAAAYGHTACVKLLLEHGAREYCLNKELESALHLAVKNDHKRGARKINCIVSLVCKAGIEINLKNINNLTARAIACKNSLFEAATIIAHDACQPSCDELRKKEASTYFSLLPPEIVLHALAMAITPCPEKILQDQALIIT